MQASLPTQFVQDIFSLESPLLTLRYIASEKVSQREERGREVEKERGRDGERREGGTRERGGGREEGGREGGREERREGGGRWGELSMLYFTCPPLCVC